MAHRTKTSLFGLFLVSLYMIHTSNAICFQRLWDLHITNGIENHVLLIHPTDKDGHDKGIHVLQPNEMFSLHFCEKFAGSTTWHSDFMWGEKLKNFPIFNDQWRYECAKLRGSEDCFWLVREDGFYMSAYGEPFPKGWSKKYDWDN